MLDIKILKMMYYNTLMFTTVYSDIQLYCMEYLSWMCVTHASATF